MLALNAIFSIAFHPQFSTNSKFYVCYAAPSKANPTTGKLVVSEFTSSKLNKDLADAKSEYFKDPVLICGVKLASDNYFWDGVRKGYRLKPAYINVENGSNCIQSQETLKNFIGPARDINNQRAYNMRSAEPALTFELN